ncbi:MAG: cupin domain-containing protein [Nitrospinaceae bacterium]|jgi:quercetin dioxygenase-like cupin family protein|nr:cupin domain-containing protein [Nitrospinaceae bacterium]MBT3433253.1 cupin domain-containing protein [Nitrospinaceae bacterium]MBT3820802.1 cupin domain-containing protein [Nitrospinaceae bacterium]MBT4431275.1 cupin domain-containing protein [Nitrospinaceae bacterium]MBT5366593.1 cupin domain-containing protein [Nitrospinaceae bacterium]
MPFYDPKKMKRALAGETYSTSEGVWATGERMLFGIIDKPAGTGSRPHRHANEQFILVHKGTLKAMIEGKRKTVKTGGIIHIPANALHSMVATDDEDVIFIVAKDTAWGIAGDPDDDSKVGAHLGKGAKKKVAAKYVKIADDLKRSGKSLKSKPLARPSIKAAKKKTVAKKKVAKKK